MAQRWECRATHPEIRGLNQRRVKTQSPQKCSKLMVSAQSIMIASDVLQIFFLAFHFKFGKYSSIARHVEGAALPPSVHYERISDVAVRCLLLRTVLQHVLC